MTPRKLLRIARWEVTKNAGGVDKRTLAVAVVALVAIAVAAPVVAGQGAILDQGLYRVGVGGDSPYGDVAETDPTFAVRPGADRSDLADGSIDLYVENRVVVVADSPKGRAALAELRDSVERYNDARLREEPNRSAAFPVTYVLRYEPQEDRGNAYGVDTDAIDGSGGEGATDDADAGGATPTATPGSATGGDADADGRDDGTTAGDSDDGTGTRTAEPTESDSTSGDAGGGGSTDGTPADDGATDGGVDETPTATGGGTGGVGGLGGFGGGSGGSASDSPSDIRPPFPFQSLVLAFVFVIPLNFLIQAYGSTILSERLNRRGELLLVAPVSRFDIIGGKTLPYLIGALVVEGAIALGLTYLTQGTIGGLVSVLAVTPLVLLFLGATFLGAMFARSFKELTFVTVTITVSLTSYAFVPAIFTDVNPIALISPLTVVVRDLQGQVVSFPELLFSITPPLLTATTLFVLGAGLYREEDMFTQRPIPRKALDALAGRIHEPWHVGLLTALLLPIVFVLELLAVALLFVLQGLSIPLILVAVAVIEELGKSLHVYASFVRGRFERGLRTALLLGAISGVAFFLAEKLTAIAQLVGLPEIQAGRAAFQTGLVQGTDPLVVLAISLLAPLVLHVVTAAVSAVGASRTRRAYALALAVAIAIHVAYNYAALTVVTGGV